MGHLLKKEKKGKELHFGISKKNKEKGIIREICLLVNSPLPLPPSYSLSLTQEDNSLPKDRLAILPSLQINVPFLSFLLCSCRNLYVIVLLCYYCVLVSR